MATEEEYRQLAVALEGVEERPYYGKPTFMFGRQFVVNLKDDRETLVVRMDLEERAFRLATEPGLFHLSPHYDNWNFVLVRLSALSAERLEEILGGARDYAASLPQPRPRAPRKAASSRSTRRRSS